MGADADRLTHAAQGTSTPPVHPVHLVLAPVRFRVRGRGARHPYLARGAPQDPWGRFWAGLSVLVLVTAVGTFGYYRLGLTVGEALYQTVITITTVGYEEIGTVTDSYRVFTILLIMFGVGAALYTLSVLIESLFEGRLDDEIRRRRMQKQIDRLSDHVVLCGFGQVGRAIHRELTAEGRTVVVIDRSELDEEALPHTVVGEATDDDVLVAAGLQRASTLVLALDSDVDNLYIALTARSMRPSLFIVARSNSSSAEPKLRQAGVDRVVNTHEIGGSRMAALVLQPGVVEFLGVVMQAEELSVRLAETPVTAHGPFAGQALAQCKIGESTGVTVLAVRRGESFVTSPSDDFVLAADDILIALGTRPQLSELNSRAGVG
ncbi:MAG: potassium channel protein [Acidimicrobiaceae bacterium]|nr:potassium channel protein [Acidimicrobiaceae bacterium]